jgi:hypothetical protein
VAKTKMEKEKTVKYENKPNRGSAADLRNLCSKVYELLSQAVCAPSAAGFSREQLSHAAGP